MSELDKLIENLQDVISEHQEEGDYWIRLSIDELRGWLAQAVDAKEECDVG
jgi:hypothetical protein